MNWDMRPLGSRLPSIRAWSVHFYTSLGLVAGLLALIAVAEGRPRDVFIFLGLALWIDSTDGMLARGWEVLVWTPRFDGRKLDDITDYLNYTFIPVFFIYQFGLVSGIWTVALPVVLLASAYGFCQAAAKTEDGYFTGFPSYWNVLAFYFYLLHTAPAVNGLLLLFFAVMVFVPIKYVYPSRTPVLRQLNIGLGLFGFLIACLIVINFNHPDPRLVYLSLIYPIYYLILSVVLHFRPNLRSWPGVSSHGRD
jgi:phosphatidylcholine synthase